MILVTLGTQDKSFRRLLDKIEDLKEKNIINDNVIVQAGHTKFSSKQMEIFDFIAFDQFAKLIAECDVLITHGGVGSIIQALKLGKKVIAVPRLEKHKEHTNDHQLEIVSKYNDLGYLIGVMNLDELALSLTKIKNFDPKQFESNTDNFIEKLKHEVDQY